MSERSLIAPLVVLIIAAGIMFFSLGTVPLLDPDEPVYAETAREMLSFGDFVSPRIYGEYWYDKPPMYYWLVAASFQLFGSGEFAARFPSALLAVLGTLYVYFAGARLFSERAGLAGSLVLASSLEYFYLGKAAVTDITLTFFLTLALLAFLEKRYYLFYICIGLATVTKGPVGFLFPGAIIFIYLLLTRSFGQLKEMKIPVGFGLFCLTALPWYVAMYAVHGSAFIDTFLGFHNITRFTSPEHPEGVLWYYFIPVLIVGFLPWTALLGQAVWAAVTDGRRQSGPLVFLLVWAAFIFLFFSVSRTKLVSYILPMYPPLAMVVGWYIDRLWDQYRGARYLGWPLMLTVFLGPLAGGMIFAADKYMPALLPGALAAAAVFAVMIAGVWYFAWRRNYDRAFWLKVIGMAAFSVILLTLLLPPAAPAFHSRDIAQAFTTAWDGKSPVYVIKFLRPGFAFYSGVYGQELKNGELAQTLAVPGKTYFVVRKPDYTGLSESDRQKLTILATTDEKLLLLKQ